MPQTPSHLRHLGDYSSFSRCKRRGFHIQKQGNGPVTHLDQATQLTPPLCNPFTQSHPINQPPTLSHPSHLSTPLNPISPFLSHHGQRQEQTETLRAGLLSLEIIPRASKLPPGMASEAAGPVRTPPPTHTHTQRTVFQISSPETDQPLSWRRGCPCREKGPHLPSGAPPS